MSEPLVDQTALDELAAVIGPEKLARLIERFVASLTVAFEGETRTQDDYGREAHTLISMAGMLGCTQLSQSCRALEQAAKGGPDVTGPLADARALRDGTIRALRAIGTASDGRP